MGVILRAHPILSESYIQCHANQEVATVYCQHKQKVMDQTTIKQNSTKTNVRHLKISNCIIITDNDFSRIFL